MKNNNKSSLGEKIYDSYVKKLDTEVKSSFEMWAVDNASDLIQYSPHVSHHFIHHGIINKGENSKLLPVFSANLRGQLYGASIGKGNNFLTTNAEIRAKTVTEYARNNFKIVMQDLKKNKKSENDFFYALRAASLVESIQCDYISGITLSERADITTGIALIKRLNEDAPMFRKFMIEMGIDIGDKYALKDFAVAAEFRGYISKFYENDLYFQRRIVLLEDKKNIIKDEDNVSSLKKVNTPSFIEGLAERLLKRLNKNPDKLLKKLRKV